jgi:hypothetical protein
LSSKFPCDAPRRALWSLLAAGAALLPSAPCGAAHSALPFWRVARIGGEAVACLAGARAEAVELIGCNETCAPIPGSSTSATPPASSRFRTGRSRTPTTRRRGRRQRRDPVDGRRRRAAHRAGRSAGRRRLRGGDRAAQRRRRAWVYAFVVPAPARRSPRRYVEYDPQRDAVATARVAIGFGAPTPRYLALRGADGRTGPNLLDRLKVRASARFFGLIPLGRNEDDIQWAFGAWHAGPIRVVRREWQWVRLGWGLRTPIFRTESIVSRDAIELPVRLRLNFPPAYFFRGIEVQAALDFRDLRGWTVRTPAGASGVVGAIDRAAAARLTAPDADWLALEGPTSPSCCACRSAIRSRRCAARSSIATTTEPNRSRCRVNIRRSAFASPSGATSTAATTGSRRSRPRCRRPTTSIGSRAGVPSRCRSTCVRSPWRRLGRPRAAGLTHPASPASDRGIGSRHAVTASRAPARLGRSQPLRQLAQAAGS